MSYDRVKESWTGTGTGTITLSDSAESGFRALSDVVPDDMQFDYTITGPTAADYEVGTGTYDATGGTLTREKVYASSNSGAKVDFSAGTKYLFGNVPATKWILSDLTIYLAATGDDDTGDGSSGTPWLTVTKALSWLRDKWIATDATVTIQLADGAYGITSPITVQHPCGAQIQIVGENTYAVSMTSVQSSSGSAGAWSIVLNLSDVSKYCQRRLCEHHGFEWWNTTKHNRGLLGGDQCGFRQYANHHHEHE